MSANAVDPMSRINFNAGAREKSGPVDVIGTNAMAKAIMMPPQAMKGMANETPVSRCCRSFFSFSSMDPRWSGAIVLDLLVTCDSLIVVVVWLTEIGEG